MSDDLPSLQSLEQIAERALTFQRYIFRKAWGTYYAVWAAAYVVFAFAWEIPNMLPNSAFWSWIFFPVVYGGVGLAAGLATMRIFGNARRTLLLRKTLGPYENRGRRFGNMWFWAIFWVVCYAIIIPSFALLPKWGFSILFALLFSVEIIIYQGLKLSFQDSFPLEGWLSVISYGACIVVSFLLSLITTNYFGIGIVWGVTIAIWLFCAFYALWRSSEELVALVY